jgi:putative transcriptional regulator
MNGELLALIPDYVLGLLPEDRRRELDALAADSPVFREEVDRVAESLAGGADRLEPALPPPAVRARLLRTLEGVERFAPFFEDLGRLFQLPLERIKTLLARIDAADGWESTLLGVPLQGARLFHFTVGPTLAAAGAAGGVVRIAPGVTFPRHTHQGPEVTYVLEGGYCVDERVYHPGSSIEVTGDAAHTYRSAPGRELVLAVLHHGIAMVKEN